MGALGPEIICQPVNADDFTVTGRYCLPNCPGKTWGTEGCGLALIISNLETYPRSYAEALQMLEK